jgi:hypothetical protein
MDIEIVGNALCLDFANTVNARPVAQWDVLATLNDAVATRRSSRPPGRCAS